uniref:ATP synthase complex subunit 8 n=1 Tax=Grypocephalus pallipectus TaxID=2813436 RepID=A0A8T9EH56_9HEMI|nr:ATP synthase F0 subunit 8 [Grypocephalus pallipectus]UNA71177.1 ATP synthase F0 subunit 8 [Grypocephalus pallipectus]UPL65769.1 ATPase subunit 8 [Grypocephalus pallipectus]
MPQMAPLWWETLFILFLMTFIFMNMIMYYNKMNNPKMNEVKNIKINQFKWKW